MALQLPAGRVRMTRSTAGMGHDAPSTDEGGREETGLGGPEPLWPKVPTHEGGAGQPGPSQSMTPLMRD
jgi:hypothetical protein